MSKMT
jgi:phage-related protein/DNA-binding XRE family transcriptional regulator